jgi:hypothetical protein
VQVALRNRKSIKLDPVMLSKNMITGVKKVKKKKKHNTAKRKVVLVATIGLPVLFSMYLYNYKGNYELPFKLLISEENRKKMGKKKRKK